MEAMECLPGVMRTRLSDSDNPNLQARNCHSSHEVAACAFGTEWAIKKREKTRGKEPEAGSALCPRPASRLSPLSATGSCDRQAPRSTTTQASLAKHVKREAGQERHEANKPDE